MVIEGKLHKANLVVGYAKVEYTNESVRFSRELEEALVLLCKELNIPIPMWVDKNTKEFSGFHFTEFFDSQFLEPVHFDRFSLRMID